MDRPLSNRLTILIHTASMTPEKPKLASAAQFLVAPSHTKQYTLALEFSIEYRLKNEL